MRHSSLITLPARTAWRRLATTASSPPKATPNQSLALLKDDAFRRRFVRDEILRESAVDASRLDEFDLRLVLAHRAAVASWRTTYVDPDTGRMVSTRLKHALRGKCCGCGCRHCIYNHEAVKEDLKGATFFNSAFWKPTQTLP